MTNWTASTNPILDG